MYDYGDIEKGFYSYDEIENSFIIESTVEDFYNGIIIGRRDNIYYHFIKRKPVLDYGDIKVRNYVLIRITRNKYK